VWVSYVIATRCLESSGREREQGDGEGVGEKGWSVGGLQSSGGQIRCEGGGWDRIAERGERRQRERRLLHAEC